MNDTAHDMHFLRLAARLALRGHGGAEPNPMVGCVIVASDGSIVGWGYHREYGGPHAEIVALRRAGETARGATLYCTLEPCNHTGRTGPCVDAIINAKIARVVIARRDPNPIAAGGIDRLRAAGIAVEINDGCEAAVMVSDPFVYRVRTGLPWVTAKWAQTLDGFIATRCGHSKWISSEASRTFVHQKRGKVDAILTGIGTVLSDNPLLTARGVRIRRPTAARRVIIDPHLRTPLDCALVNTTATAPTIIACSNQAIEREAEKARQLTSHGVELLAAPMDGEQMPLAPVLRELVARHNVATVLTEAGAGVLSRLFQQQLVNEAWVFIGPILLGDLQAMPAVRGMTVHQLTDGTPLQLQHLRRRGHDIIAYYRIGRQRCS